MNIQELITFTQNRIAHLRGMECNYLSNGELEKYDSTIEEIRTCEETLKKLQSVSG
jgi:hypothetical protein